MKQFYYFLLLCMILVQACQQKSEKNISKEEGLNDPKIAEPVLNEDDEPVKDYKRIVVIGRLIKEIFVELGEKNKIVAIDHSLPSDTSLKLPRVGYKTTLKSAYIINHSPDAVFSDVEGSPQEVVEVVKERGVDYYLFPNAHDYQSIKDIIRSVARKLNKKEDAQKVIDQMDAYLQKINKITGGHTDSVSVLYVKALSPDLVMMGGRNTTQEGIIILAGARNAGSFFEGMLRVSPEHMHTANPGVILMSTKSWNNIGGRQNEARIPGLFNSQAAKMGNIIIMDDADEMDFGVYSTKYALELCQKIYGYGGKE